MNDNVGQQTVDNSLTMEDVVEEDVLEFSRLERGQIRKGMIVSASETEVAIDIGAKREGYLSQKDLARFSAEEMENLTPGKEVPVYVVNPEDPQGNVIVSIYLASVEEDWERAEALLQNSEIVEGVVSSHNKGGLVVPFGLIKGFVPASQIEGIPRRLAPQEKAQELASYHGKTLPLRVIEVDRERRRLILSEKAARRDWQRQQKKKLLATLQADQVVEGTVSSLASFGAFVDLGGAEGLIHISELSWQHVAHPSDVLKVGDRVQVYVLEVNPENERIGLSLRRLQEDPWEAALEHFEVGQRVQGTISNVVEFGAFATVSTGIEGLIHISELSHAPVTDPYAHVQVGKSYLLEIIKIDPKKKRLALSLKNIPQEEQEAWQAQQAHASQESGQPEGEAVSRGDSSAELASEADRAPTARSDSP